MPAASAADETAAAKGAGAADSGCSNGDTHNQQNHQHLSLDVVAAKLCEWRARKAQETLAHEVHAHEALEDECRGVALAAALSDAFLSCQSLDEHVALADALPARHPELVDALLALLMLGGALVHVPLRALLQLCFSGACAREIVARGGAEAVAAILTVAHPAAQALALRVLHQLAAADRTCAARLCTRARLNAVVRLLSPPPEDEGGDKGNKGGGGSEDSPEARAPARTVPAPPHGAPRGAKPGAIKVGVEARGPAPRKDRAQRDTVVAAWEVVAAAALLLLETLSCHARFAVALASADSAALRERMSAALTSCEQRLSAAASAADAGAPDAAASVQRPLARTRSRVERIIKAAVSPEPPPPLPGSA